MSRSPSPRPRGRSSAAEQRPPAGRRLFGPAGGVPYWDGSTDTGGPDGVPYWDGGTGTGGYG